MRADGRTDRQTDLTMVIFTSRGFSKAPKNCKTKLFNLPKHFMFRMIRTIKGHYLPIQHSLNGIISKISGFHRASSLLLVTFINQLMHSIDTVVEVKICVV
jgi:hypothetical protein